MGVFIKNDDGSVRWLAFKYERLSNFYFYCGKLGHTMPHCLSPLIASHGVLEPKFAFGPWLRPSGVKLTDTHPPDRRGSEDLSAKAPSDPPLELSSTPLQLDLDSHTTPPSVRPLSLDVPPFLAPYIHSTPPTCSLPPLHLSPTSPFMIHIFSLVSSMSLVSVLLNHI